MSNSLLSFSTKTTPQSEPIPGQVQVLNNAGGFVYALDLWKAFERFLILGTEGGTFYVGEKTLTRENALRSMEAIEQDGKRAVDLIVEISHTGRAPKNDPALFCLALASSAKDPATRAYALSNIHKVARIPTHLFHFVSFAQNFRGWGRGLKRAISSWYEERELGQLAYQMVKFQGRDGWTNRDLLRLSHPKGGGKDPARNALYKWVVGGMEGLSGEQDEVLPKIVLAFEEAKSADPGYLVDLIKAMNLSREMVPTESLKDAKVWEALLVNMPPHALLRNLGNLSKVGLLTPLSNAERLVREKLRDFDKLKEKRVHPLDVLTALKVYSSGHGIKGDGRWDTTPSIIDSLNECFYGCFQNIVPMGKRLLLGVDVSGSMSVGTIARSPLTPAEGAAAMALACVASERDYFIMGFSDKFVDLGITKGMRLDDVLKVTRHMTFGNTDCALPSTWALKNGVSIDGVLILTDNETWAGHDGHPSQALTKYREKTGIPLKQVVVGMTSTGFTIADPSDPLSIDVVGFDSSCPAAISEFMRG